MAHKAHGLPLTIDVSSLDRSQESSTDQNDCGFAWATEVPRSDVMARGGQS